MGVRDEERGYEPPYFWGKLGDVARIPEDAPHPDEARVAQDRQDERSRGDVPAKEAIVSSWIVPGS